LEPDNFFPNGIDFKDIDFPLGYDFGDLDKDKYGEWLEKIAVDFGGHDPDGGIFGGLFGGLFDGLLNGILGCGGAWGFDWNNANQWNNYHIDLFNGDFNDIGFHNWAIGLYEYDKNFGDIDFDKLEFPLGFIQDGFDFDKDLNLLGGLDCHIDVEDYKGWLEGLMNECGAIINLGGWNDYNWNNCGNWNDYNFPGVDICDFGDEKFIDWSVGLFDFCKQNNMYVPNNFQFPQNYCPQWYNIDVDIPANYGFPANVNANEYKNWLPSLVYYCGG